jgi:hypothetical protein
MEERLEKRSRAHESRNAIERLYIAMRHLFIRGSYKPLGVSGESLIKSMLTLSPEIYGSITDPERVELDGLLYIFERLPLGIEECRQIRLISREGFEQSKFEILVPPKRRRNCYRIDREQMYIEMTRGRSDIYDILTHLTFMYVEAEKIRKNSTDYKDRPRRDWLQLEEIVKKQSAGEEINLDLAYTYLSSILNRSYDETIEACKKFDKAKQVNNLFHITYWLGKLSLDEAVSDIDREISFSTTLREKVGHHIHGEAWAQEIKQVLSNEGLLNRPIHIVSANLHSVMNSLFAFAALRKKPGNVSLEELATQLSSSANQTLRKKVETFALQNGMISIPDKTGTNIHVQIFDLSNMNMDDLPIEIKADKKFLEINKPIILVMDYAFGEQAFETMDELLKPFYGDQGRIPLDVQSISIMGKAGILEGGKGDIMVAKSHVFEGTADNYPVDNALSVKDFEGNGLNIFEGSMITVLGTSLQNKDILEYFHNSSWKAIGLEMEGAHYQKAIQAASKIRNSICSDVVLRYAYYASDNPLVSGQTLASGSLGNDGVKPTYMITARILNGILTNSDKVN